MKLQGALIPQYRQIHRQTRFYSRGSTVRRWIDDIAALTREFPTESILDYGCGKGLQYTEENLHEAWGVMPTLFDPAVDGIRHLPECKFDGVICTGVLEHIPVEELDQAFRNLVRYARKWCFLVIGIEPSKKTLPDGRGVHVTLFPPEWWEKRLVGAFRESSAKLVIHFVPKPKR